MDREEMMRENLSEEELQREADEIRAMLDSKPELKEIHVTDEMHERLMERIRRYDEEQAREALSEEDREALRLGRELQNKKAGSSHKGNVKVWVTLAASAAVVAGVSVTSVGSKNGLIQIFNRTFGDGDKTYIDSGEIDQVESDAEEQAYEDIKKNFGDNIVNMIYKPQKTKFLDMQLDKEMQEAVLYYSVGDNIMSFRIVSRYVESSIGMDVEDKLQEEYQIPLEKATATVQEYKIKETGELEYKAQFAYKNNKYFLSGVIKKAEFEKILKNLYFF